MGKWNHSFQPIMKSPLMLFGTGAMKGLSNHEEMDFFYQTLWSLVEKCIMQRVKVYSKLCERQNFFQSQVSVGS